MSVQTTQPTSVDISDKTTRQLGGVQVTDSPQLDYLDSILQEIRRISLMVSEIAGEDIDFEEDFEETVK